jgi:hypothetical protein
LPHSAIDEEAFSYNGRSIPRFPLLRIQRCLRL